MPTIQDIITYVDSIRTGNKYSAPTKIAWCADVDGMIRNEIVKVYNTASIARVQDQVGYTLPEGVIFDNIVKVFVDDEDIHKIDQRSIDTTGYYLGSDGKIYFYPVPEEDDGATPGIKLVYQVQLARYTATTDTLIVPYPYAKMYSEYIMAQMNYYDNQMEMYNNDMSKFNQSWQEYADFYNKTAPKE